MAHRKSKRTTSILHCFVIFKNFSLKSSKCANRIADHLLTGLRVDAGFGEIGHRFRSNPATVSEQIGHPLGWGSTGT